MFLGLFSRSRCPYEPFEPSSKFNYSHEIRPGKFAIRVHFLSNLICTVTRSTVLLVRPTCAFVPKRRFLTPAFLTVSYCNKSTKNFLESSEFALRPTAHLIEICFRSLYSIICPLNLLFICFPHNFKLTGPYVLLRRLRRCFCLRILSAFNAAGLLEPNFSCSTSSHNRFRA